MGENDSQKDELELRTLEASGPGSARATRKPRRTAILAAWNGPLFSTGGEVVDPFDDDALEKLLDEAGARGEEPRLILVDRLLNRIRFRREC